MEFLRAATHPAIGYRTTRGARSAACWHALPAAVLLALLVGLALLRGLSAEHSAPGSPARHQLAPQMRLSALPLAAQGVASAALGADRPAYRVSASATGLGAQSAPQGLRMRFGASGVEIGSGSTRVALSLRAAGYGAWLQALGVAAPSAKANRVTYIRAGLSEWYSNGPLGLEQGFTIPRAPSGHAAGPLTLSMALSGNARASLANGGQSVTFSHSGGSSLRYGSLVATDAQGRALHSWLALDGTTIVLRVDARGARYPLRIDPLIQQGEKVTAGEEEGASEAGTSVAISADGNTALIGGIGDEGAKKEPMVGAAWVFTRSGSTWTQQGPKLTGGGEEGQGQFGISVALSSDGNTALIGGINDETKKEQVGAAWVYTRSGSSWTQQGPKLTGGEEIGKGRFGKSVALSSDGNTALVGGYFDNTNLGAAWVFTRSGSNWKQQGKKLTGAGETGEAQFGISVALSSDGNTALIGGYFDNSELGAAWAFTRSGSSWSPQGSKLTGGAEELPGGQLGTSVALSADGNTAFAGAPGDGGAGAAWAFTRAGSTWSQQGPKLTPSDATSGAGFGAGVALSADGSTALIGGPVDKGGKVPTGAAWEFTRAGSTWSQQGAKLQGGGEVPESEFGAAVALSADGDTALIGGPIDNTNVGAAWAFVDPPPGVTTGAAASVGTSSATLNGTVNAGASSTARFQYGRTAAYGAFTPGQVLGASSSARPLAAVIAGLEPGTTYHFRILAENSAGTSAGADHTFTTAAIQAAVPTPPIVSNVAQSHRSWREGSRLASLSRKKKLVPLGTTFSFTLNEQTSVSFAFTQQVGGRKVKGKCVAQTRKNRRNRVCKRTVTQGTFSFTGHAGSNKVSFQGRISHSKKLGLGSYTLVITATNAGGQHSRPKQLSFTIVK
jgi:hypothetical protein